MQLLYSPTSPYARKLRVLIAELGLEGIEPVIAIPLDDPAALLAANPLAKVPALVLGPDQTDTLFDSPVIAAWLLAQRPGQILMPEAGPAHWQARTIEALCDGMLDGAIGLRFDTAAGGTGRDPFWAQRMHRSITSGIAALPARLTAYQALTGDDFSYPVACAIIVAEYLDFRFPAIDWRGSAPELDALVTHWRDRPALRDTRPS